MVEDSSLHLTSLNGLPGPYIKYFEDQIGPLGIFRLLKDFEDKSAKAKCHIAIMDIKNEEKEIRIFDGFCEGQIVNPQGTQIFGWDACFQPEGFDTPFSCLEKDVKNQISHRAKAFQKLARYLNEMT